MKILRQLWFTRAFSVLVQNFLFLHLLETMDPLSFGLFTSHPAIKVFTTNCITVLPSSYMIKQVKSGFFLKDIFSNKLAVKHLSWVIYHGMGTVPCSTSLIYAMSESTLSEGSVLRMLLWMETVISRMN